MTYEEQMKQARIQAVLKKECNGREDCQAVHHLCVCLSLKKP